MEIKNRLDFATWLTEPNHPLTARVAVNRHWRRLFGRGLVKLPRTLAFKVTYLVILNLIGSLQI